MEPASEAARDFERTRGVEVQIEPGPSGKLLSRLRVAKGSAHLFIVPDMFYLDEARKLGIVSEVLPIATMRPVIAVAQGNPRHVTSMADLLRPDVKVVLANPELASIGRSTRDRLKAAGRWAPVERRAGASGAGLSFAGTVNEVAEAVRIGAADAGIVWEPLVRQYGLTAVEDDDLHTISDTAAVGIVKASGDPGRALELARFLTSPEQGLKRFAAHGYRVGTPP